MGAVDQAWRRPAQWSGIRDVFGVDIGEGFAAVVRAGGRRSEVLFAGDPAADPERWQAARKSMEDSAGRAAVSAAMPASAAVLRWLRTPLSSSAKSKRVLPGLLDVELPFPVEECTYDFIDLHPANGGTRALAVCARDRDIAARISELEAAGVQAELLDHEAVALWQASGADPGPRAVAYLGADRTVILSGAGARVDGAQTIRMGLDSENGEELARRVNRMVKAQAESGDAPRRWSWCGPRAVSETRNNEEPGVPNLATFEQALDVDAAFDILDGPDTVLARALAERAGGGGSGCNLRAGEHAHDRLRERQRKAKRGTGTALVVTGLLLIAASFGWNRLLDVRETSVNARIASRAGEITGLENIPYGQEVRVVRNLIDERKDARRPFSQTLQASGVDEIGRLLELGKRHGLRYRDLEWKAGAVVVSGTANDWDACDALRSHFEERRFTVSLDRDTADAEQRVPFTCRAEGVEL